MPARNAHTRCPHASRFGDRMDIEQKAVFFKLLAFRRYPFNPTYDEVTS